MVVPFTETEKTGGENELMSSILDDVSEMPVRPHIRGSGGEMPTTLWNSEKTSQTFRSVSCQHIQGFKYHRMEERIWGKTLLREEP